MVMNLILIPSKLVDFPQNADLGRNFYYASLLNSHFCMGDLLWICCVFAEHLFWATSMEGCFWTFTPKQETRKRTLYRLLHLFYCRRVSRTSPYALSSHFITCKKFLLQAYFLQISLKFTWANSDWQYLKNCNETIKQSIRPWFGNTIIIIVFKGTRMQIWKSPYMFGFI